MLLPVNANPTTTRRWTEGTQTVKKTKYDRRGKKAMAQRASLLDLIKGQVALLKRRAGTADRERLE